MKKIAIAAAIAMLMAGAAQAQSNSNNDNVGDNSIGDGVTNSFLGGSDFLSTLGDLSGQQLGGDGATIANIGNDSDNNFQINMSFDDVAAGILAIARNTGTINGEIHLDGANITISAQDVEANAMAKAEAATESTSNATSNAFSGSTFSTTAIGALMSASIEVDASMITNSSTFDATDLGFTGEDMELGTAPLFGEDYSGVAINSASSEFAGNVAGTESRVNAISVALVSENVGAIDASVHLDAVYQAGNVFHAPSGGMIDLTNLNITTTAVGAINSGSIRLGSLLSQ